MGRTVMDRGFRRIKAAAPVAEPVVDQRLVLVDLFAAQQASQEPAEQPEPEPTDTAAPEASEGADGAAGPEIEDAETPAPAEAPEPEDETENEPAPEAEAEGADYDPIAAALG